MCQYMEKLSDGRNVMRSEAAESRAARQHELLRQQRVDTLLTKLQQDMEQEYNGMQGGPKKWYPSLIFAITAVNVHRF